MHFGDLRKFFFSIMANLLLDNYMNESTKLDGENYVNWKFKLMTILEGNNLWSIVSGDEPKPTVASSIPDWERRETKAKVLLRMSVRTTLFLISEITRHQKKHGIR